MSDPIRQIERAAEQAVRGFENTNREIAQLVKLFRKANV